VLKTIGLAVLAFMVALTALHFIAGLVVSVVAFLLPILAIALVGFGLYKFVL
jgi:hypothetical protein